MVVSAVSRFFRKAEAEQNVALGVRERVRC